MNTLHVILGAGQIGPRIATRLLAQGHSVRMVRRGRFGPDTPAGVQTASADLSDPVAAAQAMAGAAVVYHCANPVYTDWPRLLLPLTRGIVEGAARAGAHLVALDNVYMYGRAERMREDTPIAPVSKKGELRARAAKLMLDASARGDLPVTIGRAADFYGPQTPLAAIFGARFFERVFAGKAAEVLGDPDQPHCYAYVEDVAEGLFTLGTDVRAKNQIWHLPNQPAEPTRTTIGRAARALGMDIPVVSIPTWVLKSLGVVSPMMREVAEMTYQWKAPYIVDDSKFTSTFGKHASPWEDAWRATAAWAHATYGARRIAAA